MGYIKRPPRISYADIEEQTKIHQLLTEKKKEEIKKLMNMVTPPTSSYYNPYTFTKTEIKSEDIVDDVPTKIEFEKPIEEPLKHVVPSSGKKHQINVVDFNHTISPKRKSFIERLFGGIKTKSTGPK